MSVDRDTFVLKTGAHVITFQPALEPERAVAVCACGWRSTPLHKVAPVGGGPTVAAAAYIHVQANR